MAWPKKNPEVTKLGPDVLARYRGFIIELVEGWGLEGDKKSNGDLLITGGMARFRHPTRPLRVWIGREFVRIFEIEGVKKTDIGVFAITDAREIDRVCSQRLQTKPTLPDCSSDQP